MPDVFLTKHHGLGNDFLIALDERNDGGVVVDGDLARRLCDRRRGIGADGLIHGARPTTEQQAQGVDVVMHLFNSDGSRAELSGNGIRCLAQAVAMARGLVDGVLTVLSDAGARRLQIDAAVGDVWMVSVDMGVAGPGPEVPSAVADRFADARLQSVDMGNPHLVVAVDDLAGIDVATDGPWVEKHFVDGINVEFVRPLDEGASIDLLVWERGAGVTEACGTGACAAAFAVRRWSSPAQAQAKAEPLDAVVRMPGGAVTVRVDGDHVTLIGPTAFVADILIDDRREV